MGGKGSGRGGQYSKEVHEKIIKALEAGSFQAHAAWYAGIAPVTLWGWLKKGSRGEEPFVRLYEEAQAAIARDAVRNQTAISNAAVGAHKGDWKAAAWNLEKKHPRLYGSMAELLERLKIQDERERRRKRKLQREAEEAEAEADKPYSPFKQGRHQRGTNRRLDA